MPEKSAHEYGDDEFKEYLKESENSDPLILIINTLRCKIKAVSELYSKSLDAYLKMKDDDPLKKELVKYIMKLTEQASQTMDQFNYALLSDDIGNDDTGTNEDISDES